jgi:cytochrome P450
MRLDPGKSRRIVRVREFSVYLTNKPNRGSPVTDTLVADDPLYEELYDVRKEAEELGNLVERDMNPDMNALRERAPVQKGFLRDLLGLPAHHRHLAAVHRQGSTCFTWDACNTAFRDHERFSSKIMHVGDLNGVPRLGLLEMDEPVHRAYRNTIQPLFLKPKAFTWWRDRWINDIVQSLIERLQKQDRAELNLDFCARIPVHTITRAVGIDGDDALVFRSALMRSTSHGHSTMEELKANAATVERMLSELVAARRKERGDDVVSELIDMELELPSGERRPLTDAEIVMHARLVLIAGGGTSWRQMGITLWALLTHPEQFEAVRADRKLLMNAIEEGVRWNPTDPVFSRLVVEDTELEGFKLPADSVLEICLGAANRDPARWSNPDAYDLHRPLQGHLGFGMGPHQCLGMNVGKSEMETGISALIDAFPAMRADPDAPATFLTGGLEQRGVSALHVLLR